MLLKSSNSIHPGRGGEKSPLSRHDPAANVSSRHDSTVAHLGPGCRRHDHGSSLDHFGSTPSFERWICRSFHGLVDVVRRESVGHRHLLYLETSLGAISRLKTFQTDVKPEDQDEEDVFPQRNWPSGGSIALRDVSASYEYALIRSDKIFIGC
jgi:hypothetical protein